MHYVIAKRSYPRPCWGITRHHPDGSTTNVGTFAKRAEAILTARLLAGYGGSVTLSRKGAACASFTPSHRPRLRPCSPSAGRRCALPSPCPLSAPERFP